MPGVWFNLTIISPSTSPTSSVYPWLCPSPLWGTQRELSSMWIWGTQSASNTFQVPLSSRNLSEEAHFYLVSLQVSVSTLSLDYRVPTVSADRTPWEVVKTVVSKGAYQVGLKSDPLRLWRPGGTMACEWAEDSALNKQKHHVNAGSSSEEEVMATPSSCLCPTVR